MTQFEINQEPRVRVHFEPCLDQIQLRMFAVDASDGRVAAIATDVTLTSKRDTGVYIPALCTLSGHSAQILMDDLWEAGIRPSQGKGSAGQLEAMKEHLSDLRALVFKGK